MAITRTPIIDDSGDGRSGTVIDNAWKQEFYNQIDALAAGNAVTYGTFTPTEHYASAVVNAEGVYGKIGRIVYIQFQAYFPPISGNPNVTWLDGMPFPVISTVGATAGLIQAKGVVRIWSVSGVACFAYSSTTGANVPLNDMSSAHIILSGSYLTI